MAEKAEVRDLIGRVYVDDIEDRRGGFLIHGAPAN
jgi:hypothetical protein